MTVSLATGAPGALDADLVLVPLVSDPDEAVLEAVEGAYGASARRAAEDLGDAVGGCVATYPETGSVRQVAFVGLGGESDLDAEALREAAAAGATVARERKAETVVCLMPGPSAAASPSESDATPPLSGASTAQALTEGFLLGGYRYLTYKTGDAFAGPETFDVHPGLGGGTGEDAILSGAMKGRHLARAACTARDLVNCSPHDKTATLFAEQIAESGAEHGYHVETWGHSAIEEEGMGGLLAVNKGSVEPPSFSILNWNPDDAVNEKPVVLVGKGVVFDTGGLSLKSTKGSMDMMKADMAGAAAVVGAFEALADLEVPLHVIGLVPATDNRPGENAYVPGDVVTMHSGTTVEVLNTDAEGRMLLADALSYAKRYEPGVVVDLATLTGAQVVALGSDAAAVMTSEIEGASERLYAIQRAGERTGERVHPLPMYDTYRKLLDSDVADIKNVGPSDAGCISAGKFLEHFTDYPWLHLDVAGPAYLTSEKPYRPKGGTGFGVRLLLSYLDDYVTTRKSM